MSTDLVFWGLDVRVWQLAATVVGSIATASIAFVAGSIAYRNSYGFGPIVIPVSKTIAFADKKFEMTFEVWNRRKYPLVIRQMCVKVPGTRFQSTVIDEPHDEENDEVYWYVHRQEDELQWNGHRIIEAGAARKFTAEGTALNYDIEIDANIPDGDVMVRFLDPISTRMCHARASTMYTEPKRPRWWPRPRSS